MKKYSKFTALLMMCLMLVTSLSFTACNDDDFDTNQNRGGISLEVFGPCPVARGGELRFIGSGMDQINSVTIPGCDDITDIKVVSGAEIRVTVPQTALPGKVVLNYAGGKITTLTDITFLEPISLDEEAPFSPARVKPGQELTINGEYLNLMKEVCFSFTEGLDSANVYAAEEGAFIEHTRKAIKVIVPENAVSGPVAVSDALEDIPNLIWSEVELEVVLPSVAAAIDVTSAKPGDLITITGEDLDLVRKVVMPNEDEVEFTLSEDGKKITFNLPDNASDGAICVVPASGVKVAVANIGMVVPTNLVATPADGLRANDVIKIKGVNMDQIVSVTFPNVADAVDLATSSATEITVVMPAEAQSGDLMLNLKSGKSVPVAIATAKPENITMTPVPAPAGGELTIAGRNLDLIVNIIYAGGTEAVIENSNSTELKTTVPLSAESGALTLVMANGETVETESLDVATPTIAYIVEMPGEDVELKAGTIMTLTIANEDKLTGVKVDGRDAQFILNGNQLYINLPMSAHKGSIVKLVSGEESLDYAFDIIPATEVETVIWTGMFSSGAWANGFDALSWGKYDWSTVEAGWKIKVYFSVDEGATYAQMRFGNGSWSCLPDADMGYKEGNIELMTEFPDGVAEMTITDAMKAELVANGGLVLCGANFIINKVTLWYENSLEIAFWEGNIDLGDWNEVVNLAWDDEIIANVFSTWNAGQTLRVYFTPTTGAQFKIARGQDWKGLPGTISASGHVEGIFSPTESPLSYVLTDEDINELVNNHGLIIQGGGAIITKMTIE